MKTFVNCSVKSIHLKITEDAVCLKMLLGNSLGGTDDQFWTVIVMKCPIAEPPVSHKALH